MRRRTRTRLWQAIAVVGFAGFFISLFALMFSSPDGGYLDYDFATLREEVLLTVRKDGSVDIDYTFRFENHGDLDGIDVGLPSRHYDKGSAWAEVTVDGTVYPPDKIHKSPYVPIGLAVEFTDDCRWAVETTSEPFEVRFHVNHPHLVYVNELRSGTVGVLFRPTWFDPDLQRGATDELAVHMVLPRGHTDMSRTYHVEGRPWHSSSMTPNGRLMLTWEYRDVNPRDQEDGRYDVGAAFPERYVDKYYENDFWDRAGHTIKGAGNLCCTALPIVLPVLFILLLFVGIFKTDRERRMQYFDPELCVEGAGPRRDLTAVEAAVVMELPMERVATMILFGLERKGYVKIQSFEEPLRVRPVRRLGEHQYETDFLDCTDARGRLSRKGLEEALIELVEAVEEKMKGFDLEDTRLYYRAIAMRAWRQVDEAGTPEEFTRLLDDNSPWLQLDEGYEDRIHLVPIVVAHPGGGGLDVQRMAQGYVSRLKMASSNLASDIRSLTTDVTSVTHPPAAGSGGGGVGGGCACACACACAGGGR